MSKAALQPGKGQRQCAGEAALNACSTAVECVGAARACLRSPSLRLTRSLSVRLDKSTWVPDMRRAHTPAAAPRRAVWSRRRVRCRTVCKLLYLPQSPRAPRANLNGGQYFFNNIIIFPRRLARAVCRGAARVARARGPRADLLQPGALIPYSTFVPFHLPIKKLAVSRALGSVP